MNINDFRKKLDAVKWLKKDEDYDAFVKLIDIVEGTEPPEWLDCLLDAICVEDDYGPYEHLYNVIWRFPRDTVVKHLAESLPTLQRRMKHAPFQVSRFYIPVPHNEKSKAEFVKAALLWNKEDAKIGRDTLKTWCIENAEDEQAWGEILRKLGGRLPKPLPMDPIPTQYKWPDILIERLTAWRTPPAAENSERVFWFGGKDSHMEEWRSDLPRIVEALALRHGEKWREIKVWLNPLFISFGKKLYPEFVETIAKSPEDIRNRALENIKKVMPKGTYENLCKELLAYGIIPGKAIWLC